MVAHIARHLALSRQSVQRVADAVVADGLCAYAENPRHRRAKLLELTESGRAALADIQVRQHAWSSRLGIRIGVETLRRASDALGPVVSALDGRGAEPDANLGGRPS